MIKSITAPKLAEILPSSIIQDAKIQAAAKALDKEIEKLAAEIKLVLHLPRLDELPEDILDHLAWQYHCDFYKSDLPIEVKRNQIRETIFWHRIKGTPAGVEKSLSNFMVGAKVEENWQYGGEAYFFRITCKGLKYLSTEEEFLYLIYSAKNVRSWLEGIIIDLTLEEAEKYHVGHAELEGGNENTYLTMSKNVSHETHHHSIAILEGGIEFTKLTQNFKDKHKKRIATVELESGMDILKAEI